MSSSIGFHSLGMVLVLVFFAGEVVLFVFVVLWFGLVFVFSDRMSKEHGAH